ncbi:cytochrome c550 [Thalassobacillus sp. CUG 92003]|uniref:cytochrome c550 n=1 Tax=Thalassobacillus sp. CUG 92003 TaxID=2736641 RepID=UPI0015E71EB4|nr:cytochrome c [Thalassobacillus sp. CUG 92003]
MKRNPVIPFGLIAVLGILVMIVISAVGTNQQEAIEEGDSGEQSEEQASSDPEEIFQNNCAQCHGSDLSGGNGPALQDVGSSLSKDDILGVIQEGPGAMPANAVQGEEADLVAEWLSKKTGE